MKKGSILSALIAALFISLLLPAANSHATPIQGVKIISGCPLPGGEVGEPYSHTLKATDGVEPLFWYIPPEDLPPGLSLDKVTGRISGTPTRTGKYAFAITVYDAKQNRDGPIQCGISITQTPTITPTSTPTPTPVPFDYSINALQEVIILDPNLYNPAGKGTLKATQQIDAVLLSGSPRSGTFAFSNVPEGIGFRCGTFSGNLGFQTTCDFFFTEPYNPPKGGDYVIEVSMPISKFVRSDSFLLSIPMLNDISVMEIKPVQVVYDAELHGVLTLVKGKGTVFKAIINSTYSDDQTINIALNLPPEDWDTAPPQTGSLITTPPAGWSFPSVWGPIVISPGTNEVILPYIRAWEIADEFSRYPDRPTVIKGTCIGNICGPDVRVVPRPTHAGIVNYEVVVDPENSLGEAVFSNNSLSGSADSISTRPWNFYIVPYQNASDGCAPESEDLQRGSKRMLEYLLALFPIADSEFIYSFAPVSHTEPCVSDSSASCVFADTWESRSDNYEGFQSRYGFLSEIADLAISEGYDMAIGVGCGCGGGASGVPNAFFSGDCDGRSTDVMAHEFNHIVTGMGDIYSLDCLAEWDESYCEHPDGTREYFCYDDALHKRAGYIGTNCWLEGLTLTCTPDNIKTCSQTCYCSIYEENWEHYPRCVSIGPCNATCCKTIAEHFCDDGTVYTAPDGRIFHPASEGLWVNKYLPVSASSAYIMDAYNTGEFINNWMRLQNTYQHCTDEIFYDGYLRLLRNTRFLDSEDPEALLVSGELRRDGVAYLNPFLRLVAPSLDLLPGEGDGYSIVLLDAAGQQISISTFEPVFRQTDPGGGEIDFFHISYRVEWIEGTKRIELRDPGGNVLAFREVSQNTPQIRITAPYDGKTHTLTNPLAVAWTASDADGDALTYSISISTDGMASWQPLAVNISGESYAIETSSFTEGAQIWIKVRVTDGVNTSEDVLGKPVILTTQPTGLIFGFAPRVLGLLLLGWVIAFLILVWGIWKLIKLRREKEG